MAGRRDTGLAALAGLAAGAVTLGVGSLVALLTGPSTDPLVAVGSAFVDATPAWLKDFAASTFGTADKVVLGIGEVVVLLALAALAGVLAARRWAWGATLVVVLGAVAGLAAMGRPDAGTLAAAPAVIGAVAGLLTLRELVRRLPGSTRATASRGRPAPRVPAGHGRGGSARAWSAWCSAGPSAPVRAERSRRGRRSGSPLPPRRRSPCPPVSTSAWTGSGPWQTPADEFYRIDTALVVPQVDPQTWTLRVHGMVEEEVTLTWDELLESDLVEAWVTLACVSNPVGGDLIGNQKWLGMPIADLLARARPTGDADMVLSRSVDGFTASSPLAALTDGRDALLAIAMDGEPLPVEHGFPVRMVVPGLYGYVSATKWVTELKLTRFADETAYWTDRGWSPDGPDQDAVTHRGAEARHVRPRRAGRRGGDRLGAAPRHHRGAGARGAGQLERRHARRRRRHRLLAAVVVDVGRRAGRVPALRPRVRPAGLPDGRQGGRHPGRRHGLRHRPREGHLTARQ